MTAKREEVRSNYRHIQYNLVKWSKGTFGPNWNYYIWFREDQFKDCFESIWLKPHGYHNDDPMKPYYKYEGSLLRDLDWHGGISYYKKHQDPDTGFRCVEAGCDYSHIWDEGRVHSFTLLELDAKRTIDRIWERFNNIQVQCSYNGRYYPLCDMVVVSKEGVPDQYCSKESSDWYVGRGFTISDIPEEVNKC